MANESHCTRAVCHVLETIYPVQPLKGQKLGYPYRYSTQKQTRLVVASYSQHFQYLWGIGAYLGKGFIDELAVLCDGASEDQPFDLCLVNDASIGTGEADRDAQKRTTIYDYLVALTLNLQKQRKEGLPYLRILVLDAIANQSVQFFGGRMFLKLLPQGKNSQFSWVRIVPLNIKKKPHDNPDPEKTVGRFLELFGDKGFDTLPGTAWLFGGEAVCMGDLASLLRPVWIGELGKAEEHHDVANLLSPLVLVDGLKKLNFPGADKTRTKIWGESSRSLALAKLLESLDTFSAPSFSLANDRDAAHSPSKGFPVHSPLTTKLVQRDFFGRFSSGVRFLLIDDKALTGFDSILANLLFGDDVRQIVAPEGASGKSRCVAHSQPHFSLETWTTPEEILTQIDALVQKAEKNEYARTLPTSFGRDSFDILLLDLRLFSGSEAAEQTFLKSVQDICSRPGFKKHLQESKTPIATRLNQALKAVQSRLEKASALSPVETPELLHLTCLSLLITFLDPSCPIVIFSSTQQRSIIEMFAPFPNVITTFSKPVFGRYSGDANSSENIVLSLKRAVVRALEIHEERIVWERLALGEAALLHPDSKFVDWLESESRLDADKKVKSSLCNWYSEYITSERYFDGCSILWEIAEGLMGANHGSREHPQGHHLTFQHQLRSRKTHGGVLRPQTQHEMGIWRTATILQWLLFLDFIQNKKFATTDNDTRPMQNAARRFYEVHGQAAGFPNDPFEKLRDGCLIADAWLPFVTFGAASLVMNAYNPNGYPRQRFISEEVFETIKRLCAHCFAK